MVDGIVGVGGEIECRNLLWEYGGLWLDVLFLIVVLLYVGGEVVGIYGGGVLFFVCVVKDGGGVGCLKIFLGWGLVFFVGCAF